MNRYTPTDLASVLAQRAQRTPDGVAYRYVGSTSGATSLTYGQLRDAAWSVAATFGNTGARGERALVLYPPGLEFIGALMGCLSAGVIAVPAPVPNLHRPERSLRRLAAIVRSSTPRFALTTPEVYAALAPFLDEAFDGVTWLTQPFDAAPTMPRWVPLDDDVAVLQFTSGSTADPKGVVLRHDHLLDNVASFDDGWEHGDDAVLVNWLPTFHDLGLVYGVLMPLWGAFPGLLMSPIDVIQNPARWLRTISTVHATHSTGPNFIYDLCVDKVRDRDLEGLDLSSWRVALTAAEPVRASTLDRFSLRFGPVGFRRRAFCPGYGLSEGTCKVSAAEQRHMPSILTLSADALEQHEVRLADGDEEARRVVGCGKPGRGVRIHIVDPETCEPLSTGRVGEVWVAGPGVAQRYWDRGGDTEQCLRARLANGDKEAYLRTGDLGFLHDGELYVTGRIKDVIIVRGANHYPQDIEQTVENAHQSLRKGCVAAFPIERDGEEVVAVAVEFDKQWTRALSASNRPRDAALPGDISARELFEEVRTAIVREVAASHGIRVDRIGLLPAGSILKTTSGKIRRRACKAALRAGKLREYVLPDEETPSPATPGFAELLRKVTVVVADATGIALESLDPDTSLHSYGIDSLAGVNIAYELGEVVGHDVPPGLLADLDTIRELTSHLLQGAEVG
jgi:acyl-CoA synthetase (AMP-forming)/AMP-acid ligase II/acyl carrier protein